MNHEFTFAVPCLFGLEGLVGDELRRMKLDNVRVEDRRAFFTGGPDAMARANLRLRMGERVMILLGRFPARTFEELYQGVKALPLEPQACSSILLFLLCLCQFGGVVDFMDQPLYINGQCQLLV